MRSERGRTHDESVIEEMDERRADDDTSTTTIRDENVSEIIARVSGETYKCFVAKNTPRKIGP